MGLEKIKDITQYRDDNNLDMCIDDLESCPCRLYYRKFAFCDFAKRYGLWLLARRDDELDHLVQSVCSARRDEVLEWRFIAKFGQKSAQDFFSKVQPGDRVYCTTELSDVIYLENLPYDLVKYKTLSGEERTQHAACFRNISKADFSGEFKVEGKNSKARAEALKEHAHELGFRVELIKLEDSYSLKIFGDSQDEVDDFIAFICNNDFNIKLF